MKGVKFIKVCLQAFRWKTFSATLAPIFSGTVLAFYEQGFYSGFLFFFTVLSALSIQIATNLFNDIIDFKKGTDTGERLGPERVSQRGLLKEKSIWLMSCFFCFMALVFGFPLVLRGGIFIALLGLCSLFLAYFYTGGKKALSYTGLGDIFCLFFFGIFAVTGTYYLQTLSLSVLSLISGLQMGFLAVTLLAINNLRDSQEDRRAEKKTLAVRFGDSFVLFEITVCLILTYILQFYYFDRDFYLSFYLPFLTLPWVLRILHQVFVFRNEKKKLNFCLHQLSFLQLIFSVLFCVGFLF